MATGIPANNGKRNRAIGSNGIPFKLEYEGKAPREEILACKAAKLQCVLRVLGQHTNRLI